MKRINVGIIGVGFIGGAHIEAIRRLGYADIKAIAINDEKLAREAAEKYGISICYTDYHELLKDSSIDVVHNCTPNNFHHLINKEIIKSKKHILSEKPLTMNSNESSELVRLVNSYNVVNAVNFVYRQFPMVQQIRSMIKNGELGQIYAIHGSYLQDWLLYDTDYNWRVEAELGGPSRVIADIGSHWCDIAQYLLDSKIQEVMANLTTFIPVRKKGLGEALTFSQELNSSYVPVEVNTEDFGMVMLNFDKGIRGCFTASQVSAGSKNGFNLRIDGSKASVYWEQENSQILRIGYRDKANEYLMCDSVLLNKEAKSFTHYPGGHNEGWPDALKNMIDNFYKNILYGSETSFATFQDAHYIMKLVDSVLKSNSTRMWEKVV